jgi:hypothetical protein
MGLGIAAVGIAALGTAASITSSAMSADASKKAAAAGGKVSKTYQKDLEAATALYNANVAAISASVSSIDTSIKIPNFTLLGTPDVYKTDKNGKIIYNKKTGLPTIKSPARASAVLEGIKAANLLTTNTLSQLETIVPGARDARAKAMEDIKKWETKLDDQYKEVQKAYPLLDQAGKTIISSEEKLKMSDEQLKKAEERIFKAEERIVKSEEQIKKSDEQIKKSDEQLKASEQKFLRSEEQIAQANQLFNLSQKQYATAGELLKQQLPQLQQARDVAGKYLLGDLPDVTKRQITRAIAEFGGAGYNPAAAGRTSGFQVPQGMLSENLAQAAEERQRYGLSAISNISDQTSRLAAGQVNVGQGIESAGRGILGGAQSYQNIGTGLQNIAQGYQAGGQGYLAGGQGYQAAAQGLQAGGAGLQNIAQGYLAESQGYQNIGAGLQNIAQGIGAAGAASANIGEAARGMQATNMAWQSLSQGFLQNAPQIMSIGLAGRGQDIDKRKAEIAAQLEQQNILANLAMAQYGASTGAAQGTYQARTSTISNNLAASQSNAQLLSSIGQGLTSVGNAGYGAYNQYATAKNAGSITGYNNQQYVPQMTDSGGVYYTRAAKSLI